MSDRTPQSDLRAVNAEIAGAYDLVPFDSPAIAGIDPAPVFGVAALYGITPPAKNFDALDLGCGTGAQLEHLATLTQGRVVGADLSRSACDRAERRCAYARDLMSLAPRAVRLNAAEFAALADVAPQTAPDAAVVESYARARRAVIGLSGEADLITDGERSVTIANGHPLMARVTAMGCAASAIVAACLAVEQDALTATAAAMLIVGVAGEQAAARSQGPGSFAAAILDALYLIDGKAIADRARTDMNR